MTSFVHLHLHSDKSILDSIIKIPDLISRIKELNQPAVAITDHGVVTGAIQLYNQALKAGIKPLIGMEAYLSPTDDHTLAERIEGHTDFYHLNLLALNAEGVSQLYQLSSIGYLEGFYRKPRISLPLLETIGKDILVLGACVKGPVSWNIYQENYSRAEEYLLKLKDMFEDRFYLECMDHNQDWQSPLNDKIKALATKFDVAWLPTNDAHFLTREDSYYHTIMLCLQLKKTLEEYRAEGKMFYPEECYVKSTEEMILLFGEEACSRTVEVADRIDIQLVLNKPIFPEFTITESE